MLLLDFNPFYIKKIRFLIKKYNIDLIHIDYVYGINCLRIFRKIPISYNSYNVEFVFTQQVGKYSFYNINKLFRFLISKYVYFIEKLAVRFIDNINAVSKHDRKQFLEIYRIPEEKLTINPFGYRLNITKKFMTQKAARKKLGIAENKFLVIFHGNNNSANIKAVRMIKYEIAPKITDSEILFLIGGKLLNLGDSRNIRFLGYIKDLKPFLYASDIALVPILKGSGTQTKIIDYLSATIPVITTRKGAEGIIFDNGVHGYIVDTNIEDMIEKILILKNNPEKLKKFKLNIRELLAEKYDWGKILTKISRRYKKIIESHIN